jgi:hypothetical protein
VCCVANKLAPLKGKKNAYRTPRLSFFFWWRLLTGHVCDEVGLHMKGLQHHFQSLFFHEKVAILYLQQGSASSRHHELEVLHAIGFVSEKK